MQFHKMLKRKIHYVYFHLTLLKLTIHETKTNVKSRIV